MGERITKVHVSYEFMNDSYGLWLGAEIGGKLMIAEPMTFAERPEGHFVPPPINLRSDEAQSLANALWDAGVRPQQSQQGQGALEATNQHLADMREIAFHKLGIGKGKA